MESSPGQVGDDLPDCTASHQITAVICTLSIVWPRLQCSQRPILLMLHEQDSVSSARYLGPHLRSPASVAAHLHSVSFKEIRNGRKPGSGYTKHVIIPVINIIIWIFVQHSGSRVTCLPVTSSYVKSSLRSSSQLPWSSQRDGWKPE
jgi:hypothetical protein